jgi:glycosyl transferase family 2
MRFLKSIVLLQVQHKEGLLSGNEPMKVNLLDLFLLSLVTIHLAESYWYLRRMKTSLDWLGPSASWACQKESTSILHLLIPVYQEALVIASCVEYFEKFSTDYPSVQVYYITSEKEGINGPTIAALQELSKYHSFSWLHYPEKDGMKADQLNWAIQQILANTSKGSVDNQQTYFGIYDVDSRPEREAIETMLHAEEFIYQQPSIYLENYKRVGSFQKAGALLQTKWELCRNVPALRDYQNRLLQKHKIRSLPCCTGHGLFVRSDILHQPAPFNTETLTEDLELGYRLAFNRVPIALLKGLDFTEYAPTPLATIRQTSRWFSGEANLYRYYKQVPKSWYLTLLVLKRYYLTFKWAFGAPLIFFALAVLIIRHPASIILICLSICLYIYMPFKMLHGFPRWKEYLGNAPNFFILVPLGTVRPLFNALGPSHYFLSTLLNSLLGKSSTFVRTPKN